jgi:hypothetical protein
MERDYTKYTVKDLGEYLNKRQLVFQIVKDYIEKKKPSFDELKAVFKDEIQGSKGFIRKSANVVDPKRFNTKMPLKIKYGVEVVVSNQWGSENILKFIELVESLGYTVEKNIKNTSSNAGGFSESLPDTAGMNNSNGKNKGINYYTFIRVYKDANADGDYTLESSAVCKTNGKYVLYFGLSNDGDGVIDGWHFYDIKNNVFGGASSPYGFDEFTDADEEWIEEYDSFEDFGYDTYEIGNELDKMRIEFVEKYLNEKSKENLLYEAAVPVSKTSQFEENNNPFYGETLVFEIGDKKNLPELWANWI